MEQPRHRSTLSTAGRQRNAIWRTGWCLALRGCCVAPHSIACDRAGSVETALRHVNRYRSKTTLGGAAPTLGVVRRALGAGDPPIAQIRFAGRGSHVVLLAAHGVDGVGRDIVRLGDPARAYNPTDLFWSQAHRYRGGVRWTHVCWTKLCPKP